MQLAKMQRTVVLSISKAEEKGKGFPWLYVQEVDWLPLFMVEIHVFL